MKALFIWLYAAAVVICVHMTFPLCADEAHAFMEKPEDVIEGSCGEENSYGKKILVAYDTKHGSTSTIADKIVEVLCERGFQVDLLLARHVKDLAGYDAVIIGTPIYYGKFLPGAKALLRLHSAAIASVPHALFTNCTHLKEDSEEIRTEVLEYFVDPELEQFPDFSPDDIGLFGGEFQFEELYWFENFLMKRAGYEDGDYRDFDKVASWAIYMADMWQ